MIQQLAEANFGCYLDLATGLPSQGYLHELVPATVKIIYNDRDPATVAYSQRIVGGHPNIRYINSDLRHTDQLLAQADEFFGGQRKIGICVVGVSYFIDDAALTQVLQALYDWAAPGSQLAISFLEVEVAVAADEPGMVMYRNMGSEMFPRRRSDIERLMGSWQPVGLGLQSLDAYIEAETGLHFEVEATQWGESMSGGRYERP